MRRDHGGGRSSTVLILLCAVVLIGTAGFYYLLKLTWVEALYLAVITLTTVGYGDITPLMRVRETGGSETMVLGFTVLLVISGMGIFAYSATELTEYILSGRYERDRVGRRTRRSINRLLGHTIVCGSCGMARHMMRELIRTGREFVCLDENDDSLEDLRREIPGVLAVHGDPLEEEFLLEAGLDRAAGILLAFPEDRDNLLLAMTVRSCCEARKWNIPRMIGRVRYRDGGVTRLQTAGAVSAVSASFIGGRRMASEMLRPAVTSFLDTMLAEDSRNVRVEEIHITASSSARGQRLDGRLQGVTVLALRRDGKFQYNPPDHSLLETGDVLVVVGGMNEILKVRKNCAGGSGA